MRKDGLQPSVHAWRDENPEEEGIVCVMDVGQVA